ncbi:hypothetical protein [Hoeflea olei]|uniref:DUF4157 domain-containing protein n=1 Tax=Hoeflea olei TaxID=1480615 RepID=A0A1C1YTG1_9HYPH|nr:hypothetical protein [Hoeflea olei]OCW56736.1 hypothetical protein AWJ14_17580 [Hoeflea olei]
MGIFPAIRYGLLLAVLVSGVSGCRTLSGNETLFLSNLYSDQIRYGAVRLHSPFAPERLEKKLARELDAELAAGATAQMRGMSREAFISRSAEALGQRSEAVTLGNNVFYRKNQYAADFARGFPEVVNLSDLSLLAHELVHVWQHQNRARTGYSLPAVAREHLQYKDPYAYAIKPGKPFLDYRFEQQGRMMQDYVFLAFQEPVLGDRDRARLKQLRDLLETEFDLSDIRRTLTKAAS